MKGFLKSQVVKYREQNTNLTSAIICDIDGTLAFMNGRSPYDASNCFEDVLNKPVAAILEMFDKTDSGEIILLSGRSQLYAPQTMEWLEKHDIPYSYLYMRKVGDDRKDSIIKRELFEEFIENKFYVEFVLDDRNQVVDLWRKDLNLPCFQVYYGDF